MRYCSSSRIFRANSPLVTRSSSPDRWRSENGRLAVFSCARLTSPGPCPCAWPTLIGWSMPAWPAPRRITSFGPRDESIALLSAGCESDALLSIGLWLGRPPECWMIRLRISESVGPSAGRFADSGFGKVALLEGSLLCGPLVPLERGVDRARSSSLLRISENAGRSAHDPLADPGVGNVTLLEGSLSCGLLTLLAGGVDRARSSSLLRISENAGRSADRFTDSGFAKVALLEGSLPCGLLTLLGGVVGRAWSSSLLRISENAGRSDGGAD